MSTPPIPELLQHRPTFHGYVIPYTVLIDDSGVPDFKVTDLERWLECATSHLCSLCGTGLDYWVWYIGSAAAADAGIYTDLAMHRECCTYAAATCPFIADGKDYADTIRHRPGYTTIESAPRSAVSRPALFASKRRRDQLTILSDGLALRVRVGKEWERIPVGAPPPLSPTPSHP
jgi:hypothetical protein